MKTKLFAAPTERQLLEEMNESLTKSPVLTRSAVKALNSLFYMLSTKKLSEETIRNVYITLLKGFQSKDLYLKLCIYSAIEEMSKLTNEGLVGINILMNDLNGKIPDDVKAMALRTLFSIVPDEMVYDFGKYVNQAFISTSQARKDMSIVVAYKLLCSNFTQVKKWLEGVELSGNPLMDYHITGFLAQSRRLHLSSVEHSRGPAGIIGVRMVVDSMKENSEALPILRRFLNSKYCDEMIFMEAARAVSGLSEEYGSQFVDQAVQSLRIFLKSTNIVLQFSAIRIVSQLAQKYPQKVSVANKEIEDLVSSENKSISMFAITSLLKTGTEETIDRLVSLIPSMVHDMGDGFKKIAIDTLESLSNLFESRKFLYVDFLGNSLLQRGELEFKKYIIEVISRAVKNDGMRERILEILCTYIEDSQYYQITLDVLGILGQEIPKSRAPSKYVVHVLNRLILENNHVRAGALQCLYNISSVVSPSTVENAMKRCLGDQDESIRETAAFLLRNMKLERSCKPFSLDELGDLKGRVLQHIGKSDEDAKAERDTLIKNCRELILTEPNADVQIKVIKKVYEDKIILEFSLENSLEGIQICDGVLNLASSDGEERNISIKIEQIEPLGSLLIAREWNVKEGCVINGAFDFTICMEGDMSDTETDSISLEPFQITTLDFVKPARVKKSPNRRNEISFNLQGDIYTAGKKILDLLNMKIISQESESSTMSMVLNGEYYETPVIIHVKLVFNVACKCAIEVYCDNEQVAQKIVRLFD
ncbi:vesicle coat complex protein Sec21 gamma subunit [Encephalitozoon intestinalis ATCC 50506]|uniref:Coatomer subunit gamma n=1 Tax=Encephalitozoon intestinalis (strain ATCC 50506) TaxID=876142 RepID=E0S627_ENCIT|nr:vesicle coat complex protein Sec21 gamma subunit [Encephalitozoon intestinalis ATCC 50506]ADM11162.1 vesicle coat complex protein Sec21 gamma subunit [Encephalitozoon intestinalis ATCC 50506]UTX44828.1 vesicle coat complex protein Sec21 gamma subunit [Encephalitozoon intestinalis]